MDADIDEVIESQAKDLEHLTKILEFDANEKSRSTASCSSQSTSRTAILSSPSKEKNEEADVRKSSMEHNKLTDTKLQRLERTIETRFLQCKVRLTDIRNTDITSAKKEKFYYINCGKPYFRDANNFPAPDNSDTVVMQQSQMYDFSRVSSVPGWTVKDKSDFVAAMLIASREMRAKELDSKIAQIRRSKDKPEKEKKKEIDALRKERRKLDKKSLKDIVLPPQAEYDWDTIANKLNCRHSPHEYRALWKVYLHPGFNKAVWEKDEHLLLQQLAHSNIQDWDQIAEHLNTNRSGYQCFVYYRTNMSNTLTGSKWSIEEEGYLRQLIDYYKEDNYIPWGRVASAMVNRTKIQIYNKYMRLIEFRKGRFLPEEDAVILNGVEKYGQQFRRISKFLPGRSHVQIRNRYLVLSKRSLSTVWTPLEDKKLIQLMGNQDSEMSYSSICDQFPGKDRINIRARYVTLLKWIKRNPNVDLARAPRRGARRLCHGQAATNINRAVERLQNRMKTEFTTIKKAQRVTKDSDLAVIEESIVAFLVTDEIRNADTRDENDSMEQYDGESTRLQNTTNLRKLLVFLKANLNQNEYMHSSFARTFPDLGTTVQEMRLEVKSYSKKGVINTIKVNNVPDPWGGNMLGATEYVLPPHLLTLTGCKALIAQITARSIPRVDLNALKGRIVPFREQLYILMERFNILFIWPMLLSNEGPDQSRRYSYVKKYRELYPEISPLTNYCMEETDQFPNSVKAEKSSRKKSKSEKLI